MAGYIISVCGVLYLNFSLFNYFESYDKQIRLAALEQVMERENENYRAIADSYAEIRNIKHDLKNQVNVLNDLIKDNKYDEARKYINQLHKEVERSASVCYTGNSAVDSIINLKGDYAKSHNIEFITKSRSTASISTQLEYAVFLVTPLIMPLKPACVQKWLKNMSALPCISLTIS